MTTHRNIFAYTVNTHPYPAFMSLNERSGKYVLSVREPAKPGPYSDEDSGEPQGVRREGIGRD